MPDRRSPAGLTDTELAVRELLFTPYATGRPRVRPTREWRDADPLG